MIWWYRDNTIVEYKYFAIIIETYFSFDADDMFAGILFQTEVVQLAAAIFSEENSSRRNTRM